MFARPQYDAWQPFDGDLTAAIERLPARQEIKSAYARQKRKALGRDLSFKMPPGGSPVDWNSEEIQAWAWPFFSRAYDMRAQFGLVPVMKNDDGTREWLVVPPLGPGMFLYRLNTLTQTFEYAWALGRPGPASAYRPDPRVEIYVDTEFPPNPRLHMPFTTPLASLLRLMDHIDTIVEHTWQANFMNAHPPFVIGTALAHGRGAGLMPGRAEAVQDVLFNPALNAVEDGENPNRAVANFLAAERDAQDAAAAHMSASRSSVAGTQHLAYGPYGERTVYNRYMAWYNNRVLLADGIQLLHAGQAHAPERFIETYEWVESRVYEVLGMASPHAAQTRAAPNNRRVVSFDSGTEAGGSEAETETIASIRGVLQRFLCFVHRTFVAPTAKARVRDKLGRLIASLTRVSAATYLEYLELTNQKESEPYFRMKRELAEQQGTAELEAELAEAARRIRAEAMEKGAPLDDDVVREHLASSPEFQQRMAALMRDGEAAGAWHMSAGAWHPAGGAAPAAPQFVWQPARSLTLGDAVTMIEKGLLEPEPVLRSFLERDGLSQHDIEAFMPKTFGVPPGTAETAEIEAEAKAAAAPAPAARPGTAKKRASRKRQGG